MDKRTRAARSGGKGRLPRRPADQGSVRRSRGRPIDQSIRAARETLEKAGINPRDVDRVVFVGGPTQYKPLRDKVAFGLGIAPSTDAKPMTAVAEGAAVFAESIDWSSQSRGRKKSRGAVSVGGNLDISLNYISRTPDLKARVAVNLEANRCRAPSCRSTASIPVGPPGVTR